MINPKKNEIAFVVTSMGRGGAERVVSILANYYASIGWKVHIIMLWHKNVDYNLDKEIQIHDLSDEIGSPYKRIPILVYRLRKTIKGIRPMTVVSFVAQNNVLTGMACAGLSMRFVPSERIDPSTVKRNPLLKAAVAYTYGNSSLTVLQTKRAYNYFSKKIQKNSVIIYNPVSVSCKAGYQGNKAFVTAGRLEPEKNHTMLIKAFAKFSKRYPEYSLIIYGEGRLKDELTSLINELGMKDKITLPGAVSDIQEREAKADCFILSSDREGMSNALMEAMAIGLPCISTNCSGSDELITNGKNGLLVSVGDEEGLVGAMTYIADNYEEAKKIGAVARAFSTCFSTENVIDQWRNAIEGCSENSGV